MVVGRKSNHACMPISITLHFKDFGLLVGFLIILLACGAETPNVTPIGTIAPTPTPTPRVIVATTATPMPSSTPVPTMTPAPTQRVVAADTPVPTITPEPTATPGANGYRCPYRNSYSYASAANTYSHAAATPGE